MKTTHLVLAILGVRMKTGVALRAQAMGQEMSPSPASRLLQGLRRRGFPGLTRTFVGAGLLAMVVNVNAGKPDKRGALESIASKPAPTGIALYGFPGIA
jgi:hypothetical protein